MFVCGAVGLATGGSPWPRHQPSPKGGYRPLHTLGLMLTLTPTPTLTLTLTPILKLTLTLALAPTLTPTLMLTLTLTLTLTLSIPSQLFVTEVVRERNSKGIFRPFAYALAVHTLTGLGRSFNTLEKYYIYGIAMYGKVHGVNLCIVGRKERLGK